MRLILMLLIGAFIGGSVAMFVMCLVRGNSNEERTVDDLITFLREATKIIPTQNVKKKILVDMDDTIEDLLPAWVSYLNEKYNTDVDYREIEKWDICSYFPSIDDEDIYAALEDVNLWENVKPKDGAVEYLKRLIDDGYDVYLCTNSYYKTIKTKFDCVIRRYFPFIKWDKVIITSNKTMIDADCLVDDGVHNLIGGKYEKILFTAGHNKDIDPSVYGLHRAYNWGEVYRLINELFAPEA